MKIKKGIQKNSELLMILFIWIAVLFLPLLIFQNDDQLIWENVFSMWREIIPFFILFIINHFFLVPQLIFKKKILSYFLSCAFLVIVFSFSSYWNQRNRPFNEFPPPEEIFDRPPPPQNGERLFREPGLKPRGPQNRPLYFPPIFNTIIISILVLGFDSGIRMIFRSSRIEQEKLLLEKENVQNQLAFLRNQVSPHFFMNTLNNIHSLIDINTEEAKEAIIRLSKLMRHLLYDTKENMVSLKKEIEFIESYIDLMKLRVSAKVKIEFSYINPGSDKIIPALLFTSFVENAFKYGISYEKDSHISISLDLNETDLKFSCMNSYFNRNIDPEASGIGLSNSIKRLDILYGNKYKLDINDKNEAFEVNLTIPV